MNARVSISVPEGRWLLLASGPRWGPAILFWGHLLVVLLAALLLGRLSSGPLSTWEWILLGLGLTQIPTLAAVLVGTWFLVFAWRRRTTDLDPVRHDLLQIALVFLTLAFVVCLYAAVHRGLLLKPDMQVAGSGSSDSSLSWYVDRVEGATPAAWVLSLPLWVYRVVMLFWSLWLAARLVKWAAWAWACFTEGGAWKKEPRRNLHPPPLPPPLPPIVVTPTPPPLPETA